MLLGRVIGTVWATRKDEKLEGMKLQLVRALDLNYTPLKNFVVAVDSVGAGLGEVVLVTSGSSARQTAQTKDKPVDAVISAIVDRLEYQEAEQLAKDYQERQGKMEERLSRLKEN